MSNEFDTLVKRANLFIKFLVDNKIKKIFPTERHQKGTWTLKLVAEAFGK